MGNIDTRADLVSWIELCDNDVGRSATTPHFAPAAPHHTAFFTVQL